MPLAFLSASEILFIFYLFSRVCGLLVISPLFSMQTISPIIRTLFALFVSLTLAIVLYPHYAKGETVLFPESHYTQWPALFWMIFTAVKEIALGYLMGICFTVIIEAMALAGELIDTMIGFATAQFLDPLSNTFQSLLGRLLVLLGFLILLVFDLHHLFIRIITESFLIIPLGDFWLNSEAVETFERTTGQLFVYALKFGTIPLVLLAGGLVPIAFTVRVVPEMNLLLTGLPMRVLIGYYTVMLAIAHIPTTFQQAFFQVSSYVQKMLWQLAP